MFEDVRPERLLVIKLFLPDPDVTKEGISTDHERKTIRNFAFEELRRQRISKEYGVVQLLECLRNGLCLFERRPGITKKY